MIAVVDYGVGNLFSIRSSLAFIGADCIVSADPTCIAAADKVILPGVGAFGDAIQKLRVSGLDRVLAEQAGAGKPVLGICLGMQLLFERSREYGLHEGLGLLPGEVLPLADRLDAARYSIPHIGWNPLEARWDCPLLRHTAPGTAVYYVHSYYVPVSEVTAAYSTYGPPENPLGISGLVWRGNLYGTQFHPEKSGGAGLDMLRAFCAL